MAASDPFMTHEVLNQSPPFVDVNLFTSDRALVEAVEREGAGKSADDIARLGARLGRAEMFAQAELANTYTPVLKTVDSRGHRLDQVDFHPAYHAFMALSVSEGLHSASWAHLATGSAPAPGVSVDRAARFFMTCQVEAGHLCPITMTHAVVPALLKEPAVAEVWLPRVVGREYDPAFRPAEQKASVTFGMGMTEKQGGTDVRTNTTRAEPAGSDGSYRLTGHKWFLSAPMCDAFLVLAQAPGGLTCFLVPRLLPDGQVNVLRLQRLKPKLGNRSNASSEVEFHEAAGWRVGEEGRGVVTIIEMATYTRMDCALSSAGMMRMALALALNHAAHRTVFQRKLIDQPMMTRVLADMAVDSEAATALVMRLARAYDAVLAGPQANPREAAFKRIMTPAIKYWVCKTGPGFVYEAMETLGGNGYVEDGPMARIYREVPVNAIWEGSGNVMCLDVLRAAAKAPDEMATLLDDFADAARGERRLAGAVERLRSMLTGAPGAIEPEARLFVETLVAVAAGTLLAASAPAEVSDAFLASHLDGARGQTYGAAPVHGDAAAIVARASPTGDLARS